MIKNLAISTYINEINETATVCVSKDKEYLIVFDTPRIEMYFPGKSLEFVENEAEDWALGKETVE